jgi:hypothetical protein
MSDFKKHWRTARHADTDFRVEIWTGGDGKAFIKTIQIEDQPPLLFGEGELAGENADQVFALAEEQVRQEVGHRESDPDSQDDPDANAS